jgi:hypothetical protein
MRKPIPTSKRKVLMYVYTAAAITITIGGSLYGAELASKQEKKKVFQTHFFNLLSTGKFSDTDNYHS